MYFIRFLYNKVIHSILFCNVQEILSRESCHRNFSGSHIPTTKVYKEAVKQHVDAGYDLVDDIPTFNSMKNSLYRTRNKSLNVTKTCFKHGEDVKIPAEFRDFVLFDHNKSR